MFYNIDPNSYHKRAREQLDQNDHQSLFYAALELRYCFEKVLMTRLTDEIRYLIGYIFKKQEWYRNSYNEMVTKPYKNVLI